MMNKPKMSFMNIFNMCFGFLGIQLGLALQNANVSRILLSFGADVNHLSYFWLAAPLTGMIVQPIIGHYSDRTWGKLGRRRPYFLTGAILASLMLFLMPNAPALAPFLSPLLIGAGILMIMDASINVSMEPLRALVGDKLPAEQATLGFSVQTFLIGIGAVIGAVLPFVLTKWFGMSNVPETVGGVAPNVKLAFYIGAIILLFSVIWSVMRTKEYPPDPNEKKEKDAGFFEIFKDFGKMPKTMRQLGVVQFFSWFALFSMWVYMTPAVTERFAGVLSEGDAGDWVGVLQAIYNAVAAVIAFLLPVVAKKIGRKTTHSISLLCGALGFGSFMIFNNPNMLIISMIGVGIAWGSILAMPYAILVGSLPAKKMGVYMGLFNFFITLPQICNGLLGGTMVKYIYRGHSIYALVFSGICLLIGAICILFVNDSGDPALLRRKNAQTNNI
ncbi:MAG: MFS transporter [Bacteroidales bacterium]|nr:MFS transporter [Bacteroidales bacterium]